MHSSCCFLYYFVFDDSNRLMNYRLLTHCDVKCAERAEIVVLTILPPVSTAVVTFHQQELCGCLASSSSLCSRPSWSVCGECQKVLIASKCCTALVAVVCVCTDDTIFVLRLIKEW